MQLTSLMQQVVQATLPVVHAGTVSATAMLTPKSRITRILVGSPDVFEDMRRRIVGAQDEVLLQTFRWQDASGGAKILREALRDLQARKPAHPVHVSILVRQGWRERLTGTAVRNLRQVARELDPKYVQVEVRAQRQWLVGSLHAKSLVVDQKRAVITGTNPEKPADLPTPQFDTGYALRGDIVAGLRDDLLDMRKRTRVIATNLPGPLSLPAPRVRAPSTRGVPMLLATRHAGEIPGLRTLGNPQAQAFLTAMRQAQSCIRIITPNLNTHAVQRALVDAVGRGVHVKLVLSYKFNNLTERFGQGGSNTYVLRKMRRRIRKRSGEEALKHLHVHWFGDGAGHPIAGNTVGSSHAKGAAFDDRLLAVGSANMDAQSWFHSRELNVFVDDAQTTRAWLDAVFRPSFKAGVHA